MFEWINNREIDNRGISAISQCSMYDISGINGSSLLDYGNSTNWNFTNLEKTGKYLF